MAVTLDCLAGRRSRFVGWGGEAHLSVSGMERPQSDPAGLFCPGQAQPKAASLLGSTRGPGLLFHFGEGYIPNKPFGAGKNVRASFLQWGTLPGCIEALN